jgi:hypothetical protein
MVRGLLRRGERGKEAGRGAVKLIGGQESVGEGWPLSLTPALMALMPLKIGEGLRGDLREGK